MMLAVRFKLDQAVTCWEPLHFPFVDNFSDAIGSIDELSPDDVRDGLWASSNILQASPGRASKRVMVFTNRDEPCEDGTSESAK